MIANLEKGRGFRGALNYALGKDDAKIIGGNMATTTPRGMASEFRAFRELRPKLKKAVAHVSLSVEKGVVLDDEDWSDIAKIYMKKMGYGDSAYTLVRHNDSEHDHVHIIASRIRPDGSVVSDSRDYARQERVMREVEQTYGLQTVPNSWETENDKSLKKGEVEQAARTGEMPARTQLQTLVRAAADAVDNYTDFALALDNSGVRHEVQLQKEGQKWNGVKFSLDGKVWFKGADLGKKFTASTLQINGVVYEQNRDFEAASSRTINRADFDSDASAVGRSERHGRPKSDQREVGKSLAGRDFEHKQGIEKDASTERENRVSGAGDKKPNYSNIYADGGLGGSDFGHGYNVHINALAVAASSLQHKSKALIVKESAWKKQHNALQAPLYRLTLKAAMPEHLKAFNLGENKDTPETFYSYEQILGKLSFLSKKNAEGYDIYLTPINKNKHYFLVDDMTPESEKALLDAGYTPALVQESSDNNKQAILICARNPDDPDEQTHANEVTAGINKKYGDANLSAVIRPFRMAGFANKKVGKGSPFTRIVQAANVFCAKTFGLLQHVKALAAKETERKETPLSERIKKTTTVIFNDVINLDDGGLEFDRLRTAAIQNAQKRGLVVDESVADYQAAKSMLYEGYSGLDVEIAIMLHPATARKNDGADYARRTVKNAEFEQSERQHKAVKNECGGGFEI